jgi:hypothetical protein
MNNSPYLDLPPECLRLITEAMVPAMASAIIREGRLDRYVCCGAQAARRLSPQMEMPCVTSRALRPSFPGPAKPIPGRRDWRSSQLSLRRSFGLVYRVVARASVMAAPGVVPRGRVGDPASPR